MFVSVELAARIERAEARLSASCGRAVLAGEAPRDAFVEEVGGGVAVYAGPSSPMNKMIAVGFRPLPSDEQLQALEEKFARRSAPLQVEVSTVADPELGARLTNRGYLLHGFEDVLGRIIAADDANPFVDDAIQIAVMKPDDARWVDVLVTSFLNPDQQGVPAAALPPPDLLDRALRDFTDVSGFHRYSAYVGGQLAGVATLRLDDGLAQLCGTATLPVFRRRGIQSAFLRRRQPNGRESSPP